MSWGCRWWVARCFRSALRGKFFNRIDKMIKIDAMVFENRRMRVLAGV